MIPTGSDPSLCYTGIGEHRPTLRERVAVLRLLWAVAADPEIPPSARRRLRLAAVLTYLKPAAKVLDAVVSRGGR